MVNKTGLTVIISIILTIILVSTVNVGTSLFFNQPQWNDYCENFFYPRDLDRNMTQEICEADDGTWIEQGNYCDYNFKCNQEYNQARENFNKQRFFVFAGLGFILLVVGLLNKENLIQITGLATGGILVFQSIIYNLENQLAVFITLLGILLVFGVLAWKVINKK